MQQSVLLCISTILDSGNRARRPQPPCPTAWRDHAPRALRRLLQDDGGGFLRRPLLWAPLWQAPNPTQMTDAFGSKIFETIQITLVCGLNCA